MAALGIDLLVVVGERARMYAEGAGAAVDVTTTGDAEEAGRVATTLTAPGDCVLVKGSRVAGLEVVADALAGVPD